VQNLPACRAYHYLNKLKLLRMKFGLTWMASEVSGLAPHPLKYRFAICIARRLKGSPGVFANILDAQWCHEITRIKGTQMEPTG
jgi:hypothetical protein